MDRRREARVGSAFPVRVWGVDAYDRAFMQVASARNVSEDGALVGGLRCRLRPGEIIEMQYNGRQAQFRVIWVAESYDRQESMVGVKTLPSEPTIWDVNLSRCTDFVGKG
jgi:hypothetical protein